MVIQLKITLIISCLMLFTLISSCEHDFEPEEFDFIRLELLMAQPAK